MLYNKLLQVLQSYPYLEKNVYKNKKLTFLSPTLLFSLSSIRSNKESNTVLLTLVPYTRKGIQVFVRVNPCFIQ